MSQPHKAEYVHRRVVTEDMVRAVESLRAKGLTDAQIQARVGLSKGTVRLLRAGTHPLQAKAGPTTEASGS